MIEVVVYALVWLVSMPGRAVVTYWRNRYRRRRLTAWAAASGWSFVGSDRSLVDRWPGAPFGFGRQRRADEVMIGTWAGRPAVSFTYSCGSGSGSSRTTRRWHVLALPLPAPLPPLELTPDGPGSTVLTMLGLQDIQFESEDFNRAWRVASTDARFAHAVVHPRLMERLLAPDAVGSRLRLAGTDILSWADGPTSTDAIPRRLALLESVIESVPPYIWEDHGDGVPQSPR